MSPRSIFRPYAALFAVPGSLAFSLVGWLARLPIPMIGLGTVRALADRIVVLSRGRVVYDGPVAHLGADQLWELMASGKLSGA